MAYWHNRTFAAPVTGTTRPSHQTLSIGRREREPTFQPMTKSERTSAFERASLRQRTPDTAGHRTGVANNQDTTVADDKSTVDQAHVARLETAFKRLRQEVEKKDLQIREASVRAQRAEEEVEHAKQRLHKEALRNTEANKRDMLHSFLDVLDDLDRALAAASDSELDSPLTRGVELVRKGFLAKLERFHVAHDPSVGMTFDPQRHEALSTVPVADAEKDGLIVTVIREGYIIGDDILRPARVVVGKFMDSSDHD